MSEVTFYADTCQLLPAKGYRCYKLLGKREGQLFGAQGEGRKRAEKLGAVGIDQSLV